MVNGLSETVIVPDVARGQPLHHRSQSDRTALTQWKAIDHDFCGFPPRISAHYTAECLRPSPALGWADVPDGTWIVRLRDALK